MERQSLFQYLMHRFGALLAALTVFASLGFYLSGNTVKSDMASVRLVTEAKSEIREAVREADSYLEFGHAKDVDAYNLHILRIGQNFKSLSEKFQDSESLQKPFADVQNESKNYFQSINEQIQKRQIKNSKSRKFEKPAQPTQLEAGLDEVLKTLETSGSNPTRFGGLQLPQALVELIGGLLLAAGFLLLHHKSARTEFDNLDKHVSDLKIQSIILDGILNSISEALIVVDEQGRFTRCNNAAERMIGKSLKRISTEDDAAHMGFRHVETLQPIVLSELPFAKAMLGEQLEDQEYFLQNNHHPQGIYISLSSRYLSGTQGTIHGAMVVIRDISRRKSTEKEWLRARESALETAKKKSDFLAAMSHEIRTPMNGVVGMSTLLADTELSEEQSDYVGTIKQSAEALLRLINDILDHSKIEAGMIEFQNKAFDLKSLCADALELFRPAVQEKNIGLAMDFNGRGEWNFVGDAGRLRQILVNLLGNAVKFTEVGNVRLKVEEVSLQTGASPRRSSLRISVMDTGAGLDENESEFLFQKYFQTKTGLKYGGTGLGLSICHQLVGLMGGEMGLQSEVGKGSTFWFEIALPEARADQIVTAPEHSFAAIFSGHILLAEDQIINQRVAVTYLQKLGLTVDVAHNGQMAVQKALAHNYDLILMDCQMPITTGYDATKKLRELQTDVRTPIVALTAEGTSGEKKTCLSVGMDDFLTKPLELEKLTEVLHRWLKSAPQVLDLKALEKLKSYVINNKSLTDALIEDFLSSAPSLRDEMKAGLREGKLDVISQAAHALKSCSATLGATGLAELCQKIEDAKELAEARQFMDTLDENIARSSAELKKHQTVVAAAA